MIKNHLLTSIKMLAMFSFFCGVLYPIFVLIVAEKLFPIQARGSLIFKGDGQIVGSRLIGQKFVSDAFFHGRPSLSDYGTVPSAASNTSPASSNFKFVIEARAKALDERANTQSDLIMASGSGLDPHITVAAALSQAGRIAAARSLPEATVRTLVEQRAVASNPFNKNFRLVNVLELNLDLEGDHRQ